MKSKYIRLLTVLLSSLLLTACATTYKPGVSLPKLEAVPNFPATAKIALINTSQATQQIEISQPGTGYTVNGNLHDWTDSTILALERTLKKKNVVVSKDDKRSLKVAVTKAALSSAASGWSFRCTVVCTIDTGEGQPFTIGADDTGWKWFNACDGAIQKLVLAILNDERVVKVLSTP